MDFTKDRLCTLHFTGILNEENGKFADGTKVGV